MSEFWKEKTFQEMSESEWESLCDGCGKCCLTKFTEQDESKPLIYTTIGCKLLDCTTCRCKKYENRFEYVIDCKKIEREDIDKYYWLPAKCAYRLLSESKQLPWWHHLLTGTRDTMHNLGFSVRDKITSEELVDPDNAMDYIARWPAQ
ncbi:MAG: YcgN family cysteine cluster protein [Psychromonas sp.]|nr:YcgN family cysteine cluster protein [Psychromonas sp.]